MKKMLMVFIALFGFMCSMNAQSFIKGESLFKILEQEVVITKELAKEEGEKLGMEVSNDQPAVIANYLKARLIEQYMRFLQEPGNNSMTSLDAFINSLTLVRTDDARNSSLKIAAKDYLLGQVTE